jgi:protoheme IX farnesyltransferase
VIVADRAAQHDAREWWHRGARVLAVLAFAMLVFGALAHSGTTTRHWTLPFRHGSSTISTLHRLSAVTTALLATVLAVYRAVRLREDRGALVTASAIMALAGVQAGAVALSSATHSSGWDSLALAAHFSATALLFALAVGIVVAHWAAARVTQPDRAPSARYRGLLVASAAVVFVVLLTGALASRGSVGPPCAGWPLCGGGVTQLRSGTIDDQLVHRAAVVVAGVLLAAVAFETARTRRCDRGALVPIGGVVLVFAAEVTAGALSSWDTTSTTRSAWHFSAAALVWGLLIAAVVTQQRWVVAGRAGTIATASDAKARLPTSVMLRDYLRVTKPGIIVLLLVTTLGAMLIAGDTWPSLGLVLATLLGGALASGGASALNCYIDRDIDVVMARTRKRPIPTGHLTPTQVWVFGVALSSLAVVELAWLVNPLAAALALSGNLFYVGIYTRWLKRATPQNIVIGGAAGSFPPLVGWAAVTGRLDAGAFILFAIIFFWTPPHFWSLALLKANDYRRAGIPMLPVTAGERVTRRHILLYSLLLLAVTVLMAPAGVVSYVYLVAALALGGVFVLMAARMYREDTSRLAWPLFKYSNYYLAALLACMAIDRALGR